MLNKAINCYHCTSILFQCSMSQCTWLDNSCTGLIESEKQTCVTFIPESASTASQSIRWRIHFSVPVIWPRNCYSLFLSEEIERQLCIS